MYSRHKLYPRPPGAAETGIVAKRHPQSNTLLAWPGRFAYPFAVLLKTARRVVVFVIGMTVMGFGVVLLFTPGPAIVVIPAGLAILATEFVWARRLMRKARSAVEDGRKMRWKKAWKTLIGAFRPDEQPEPAADPPETDSSAELTDRRVEPPA